VEVELGDGVAELVGLGALDTLAALAGGDLLVPLALALAEVGEDFHERALLQAADRAGGEAELALAVLVEEAFVEQLFEELGVLGLAGVLHHLLEGLEGLVPVLHDELHHLVEAKELVLGGEFLAVELAVEVLHTAGL